MGKFKTFPRDINPKVYEELASRGFNSSLRLLAFKRDEALHEAMAYLAESIGRDIIQVEHYRKHGLPDHLVHRVLEILEQNKVSFGSHQLRPNSSMVSQANLDAKNTSAGGQVRSKQAF